MLSMLGAQCWHYGIGSTGRYECKFMNSELTVVRIRKEQKPRVCVQRTKPELLVFIAYAEITNMLPRH
jgi:hypothetical protein